MKICVVGAGAIGGLMAVKLALAGNDVTVVTHGEGPHLTAILKDGLKLIWEDGSEHVAPIRAVPSATEAGPADLVILAVKAHFLDQVAKQSESLLGPGTIIMTVQNGLPWWYFHKHGGEHDGKRLISLDPSGVLTKHIDADRIIGCVVYPAAAVTGCRQANLCDYKSLWPGPPSKFYGRQKCLKPAKNR